MALAVCSYPKLNSRDYKFIQDFRKENDELYYQVAEPHVGFVFPVSQIQREHFIEEIHEKSKGIIDTLTIIDYTDNVLTDLEEIMLT
ncbi:MAG TPA: hypothetical protein PLK82_03100 [Bacteroidales bacterium]|nr:hypothetical protein [Bacteroidales bacterium]